MFNKRPANVENAVVALLAPLRGTPEFEACLLFCGRRRTECALLAVEKMKAFTSSKTSQAQLVPVARPASLTEEALFFKHFADSAACTSEWMKKLKVLLLSGFIHRK